MVDLVDNTGWNPSEVLGVPVDTSSFADLLTAQPPAQTDQVDQTGRASAQLNTPAEEEARLFIAKLFGGLDASYKVSFSTLFRCNGGVEIAHRTCSIAEAEEVAVRYVIDDKQTLNLGCYVRVTPLNAFFSGTGRGIEKDSAGSQVLWADLDTYKTPYDKEFVIQKLMSGNAAVPVPTLIVDSGNGLQVYWALDTFVTDLQELKLRGKGIAGLLKMFGADSVYNPAQLLRVPGTHNRKNPLEPKPVRIVAYERGNIYALDQFPMFEAVEAVFVEEATLPDTFLDDLQRVAPEIYSRIVSEESAKIAGAATTSTGRVDRSSNDMWVAVRLFSYNVIGSTRITSGVLRALFMQPDLFLHAKTAEQGVEYALRTILQAETYVAKVRRKDPQRFFSGRAFVPALLGEELLYENQVMSAGSQLWTYQNGVFRSGASDRLKQQVVSKLGVKWQRSHAANTLEWVRAVTQRDLSTDVLPFANVLNGMLHITPDNVELLPHSPTYCSLSQMPVEFMNKEELKDDLATVDQFVSEILGTDLAVKQFFQFIGTVLIPDYRFKKVLLLIGPPDCGKSTLLSLFTNVVGEENIASRTFQDLAGGNRFARASLIGKLANVYADLPTLEAKDIGPFKALTGNDIVDAEFKGVDAVSFRNYAKLIFSTNAFPRVRFADQAFFNRWLVIPCETRFVADEITMRRLQVYEPGLRVVLMDRKKLQRFQTPRIRSAFLWRAIEGLQSLLATGQFIENESTRLVQGEFMAYADPVSGFMCSCTDPDDQGRILKGDLYNAFLSWCNYYSVEKLSIRLFNKRLSDLRTTFGFFEAVNSTLTVDGVTRVGNVIIGRRLKTHIKTATGVVVRLNSAVEFVDVVNTTGNSSGGEQM